MVWISAIIVGVLAFAALTTAATAEPNAAPGYVELDDSATALRDDFNRAKGSVRLLFVVDPICPGCLRGLDDVNRSLLSKVADARLQTFVVHVPVIGAKSKDVAPAMELLENGHVRHYWNESGAFGWLVRDATGLRRGDERVYAWDVWLIYGPEAVWDGKLPPKPRRLMHQLRALQGSAEFPRLDSEEYAREARQLLAGLSDPTAKP